MVIQTGRTREDNHTCKLHWLAGEQEVMEDGGKLMGRRQATEGLKSTMKVGTDTGSSGLPKKNRTSNLDEAEHPGDQVHAVHVGVESCRDRAR